MGMFDSIYMDIKCPRCGKTSNMECQTKDLDCSLNRYQVGDTVPTDQYRYLHVNISCKSPECMQWEKDEYKGRVSGFGYTFFGKLYLGDSDSLTEGESVITDKLVLYDQKD